MSLGFLRFGCHPTPEQSHTSASFQIPVDAIESSVERGQVFLPSEAMLEDNVVGRIEEHGIVPNAMTDVPG